MERAPITAVRVRSDKQWSAVDAPSPMELVKEAQDLVRQVVRILNDPICEQHSSLTLRMARAHALTLLDHLAELMDAPTSSPAREQISSEHE